MSQHPSPPGGFAEPTRRDFEAVLAARSELGQEMEPALVDSFASQVTAEIRRQLAVRPQAPVEPPSSAASMVLGIVSVVMLIPLTAIVINSPAPWMMLLVLAGLVAINLAVALGRRRR